MVTVYSAAADILLELHYQVKKDVTFPAIHRDKRYGLNIDLYNLYFKYMGIIY
jgi:hypothetical protein